MSSARPPFFRETNVKTDCDACGAYFDLLKGGVCQNCRRVLCARHLYGSWTHRLLSEITGKTLCLQCRHG